jgi:hypothetical protein
VDDGTSTSNKLLVEYGLQGPFSPDRLSFEKPEIV